MPAWPEDVLVDFVRGRAFADMSVSSSWFLNVSSIAVGVPECKETRSKQHSIAHMFLICKKWHLKSGHFIHRREFQYLLLFCLVNGMKTHDLCLTRARQNAMIQRAKHGASLWNRWLVSLNDTRAETRRAMLPALCDSRPLRRLPGAFFVPCSM